MLMDALDVDVFLSTGCRLLPGANLGQLLPEWGFEPSGPRGSGFGAVCAFAAAASPSEVSWRAEWSTTPRITWVEIGAGVVAVGFVVPPKSSAHPAAEREAVLAMIFEQYDTVRSAVAPETVIVGYGDLNPTPALLGQYGDHLRRRGLVDLYGGEVATHVRGRRLDVGWAEPAAGACAVVHNGVHCAEMGCGRTQCGKHSQTFGSQDLDHFPVVITCAPCGQGPGRPGVPSDQQKERMSGAVWRTA